MADPINTTLINQIYQEMMGLISGALDDRYYQIKLDPELYDKVIASVTEDTLKLASDIVQQQPTADAAVEKALADAEFVQTQIDELADSILDNRRIKAMGAYSDLVGTLGAGGLTVTQDMWTSMYLMILGLNDAGTLPADADVTKEKSTTFPVVP